MPEITTKLKQGQNLSFDESKSLFSDLMEGKHAEDKIIEILEALIKKGETKDELAAEVETNIISPKNNADIFSKDYVDFLSEAGWRLEKKFPSNSNKYSDLLEDTDWKSNDIDFRSSKHYRRDLDALS